MIKNLRRVKNHLAELRKKAQEEVKNIIDNEEITVEQHDSENLEIFKKAYVKVLQEEIDFWKK